MIEAATAWACKRFPGFFLHSLAESCNVSVMRCSSLWLKADPFRQHGKHRTLPTAVTGIADRLNAGRPRVIQQAQAKGPWACFLKPRYYPPGVLFPTVEHMLKEPPMLTETLLALPSDAIRDMEAAMASQSSEPIMDAIMNTIEAMSPLDRARLLVVMHEDSFLSDLVQEAKNAGHKTYLTVSEAADMIGVSTRTIMRWQQSGKLRPVRLYGRARWDANEVAKLMRPGER